MPSTLPRTPSRRPLAAALASLAVAVATGAHAAGPSAPTKFDRFAFERAVSSRAPVVIHFSAGWCGPCRVQEPIVAQLRQEPGLRSIRYFTADHDRERLLRAMLGVPHAGTFIVFREGHEVARSTGQILRGELRESFLMAVRDAESFNAATAAAAESAKRRGIVVEPVQPSPAAQTPFTPFSINPPSINPPSTNPLGTNPPPPPVTRP